MTMEQLEKEEAIDRVERHANPDWKLTVAKVIREVATLKAEFTTDDVWLRLKLYVNAATHEPRAMGAAMLRASKDGICQPLMRFEQSGRASCHNRPIRVWKSLLL
jgi:hypothetical protein